MSESPPTTVSPADEWPIRQCDMYKEEYKDCRSIQARFHQYFIYGEFLDCTQWKKDYENCVKWTKDQDLIAYKELAKSEKKRFDDRLSAHYRNNVWEKRTEPPKDWNKPLPEWMQKKYENSFLNYKSEVEGKEERTLCVIS